MAWLCATLSACGGSGGEGPTPTVPPGDTGGGAEVPLLAGTAGPFEFVVPGVPAREPLEFDFATGARAPGTGALPHANDPAPANPWLDWRFDLVLESPSGALVLVPGFFAGDGEGGERGDTWRVRFTPPDEVGLWRGVASLRRGEALNVAQPFDTRGETVFAATVEILVAPPTGAAEGLFARGPIRAAADGRLRDADGRLFVKAGAGSPENLLGYVGFDGAVDGLDGGPPGESGGAPDFLHSYFAHAGAWKAGDPDWAWPDGSPGAGRGLIGALNALSEFGANAIYVMPMNLGGDGRDTFPFFDNGGGFLAPNDPAHTLQYSVARLRQWAIALEHAQRVGLYTQFVLAEREAANVAWLGSADGVARRLYLKQLVAHFGHLPGVEWTLCEENAAPIGGQSAQFTPAELADMAAWIRAWDTSRHPRSVHTDPNDLTLFDAILDGGEWQWLDCASLQINGDTAASTHLYGTLPEQLAATFLARTGRNLVVHVDEPGYYEVGAASELHPSAWSGLAAAGADDRRRRVLYDSLFSSAGVLWYFGLWSLADGGGDLTTENFATRADLFRYTRAARTLLEETFAASTAFGPADELWTSDAPGGVVDPAYGRAEVLAGAGGPALVYLPEVRSGGALVLGELAPLDRTAAPGSRPGALRATWFNPRLGIEVGQPAPFDPTLPYRPAAPGGLAAGDWVLVLR